jgi:starvation-inducible DNA-binding protein
VRGYHWNIKGNRFFLLHAKYEELYDELADMADEVAERILMLEETPAHAFSEYIKMATIKESTNVTGEKESVNEVVAGITTLLNKEREVLNAAAEAGDDGTVDLMTGYISAQEKQLWMYRAFLS